MPDILTEHGTAVYQNSLSRPWGAGNELNKRLAPPFTPKIPTTPPRASQESPVPGSSRDLPVPGSPHNGPRPPVSPAMSDAKRHEPGPGRRESPSRVLSCCDVPLRRETCRFFPCRSGKPEPNGNRTIGKTKQKQTLECYETGPRLELPSIPPFFLSPGSPL